MLQVVIIHNETDYVVFSKVLSTYLGDVEAALIDRQTKPDP